MKFTLIILLLFPSMLFSNEKMIDGVPKYNWRFGCVPTTLGVIIGYYDSHGFPSLIPGDAQYENYIVDSIIASNEHYFDYSLPLDTNDLIIKDKSETGDAHSSNCLADFLKTSWSSENMKYGDTKITYVPLVFKNYFEFFYPQYIASSSIIYYYDYIWQIYKSEIDKNEPVMIVVDTDGDVINDHVVAGIGYDEGPENYFFAIDNGKFGKFKWRKCNKNVYYGVNHIVIFSISTDKESVKQYHLNDNYPNPFNPLTTIPFTLDNNSNAELRIYNSIGELQEVILNKFLNEGSFKIMWNGTNYPSGVYFYQLITVNFSETKKMILVK
jgi:hypothetical protein